MLKTHLTTQSIILIIFCSGGRANDNIAIYTAEDIRKDERVHLDEGGLLLMAVLSGCDYDKVSYSVHRRVHI